MQKTSGFINLTSRFKTTLSWLILGSLVLVAACAEGGYQTYQAPYYPGYNYPSYYPDYYGPTYPYEDPDYWRMWQDRQGGG